MPSTQLIFYLLPRSRTLYHHHPNLFLSSHPPSAYFFRFLSLPPFLTLLTCPMALQSHPWSLSSILAALFSSPSPTESLNTRLFFALTPSIQFLFYLLLCSLDPLLSTLYPIYLLPLVPHNLPLFLSPLIWSLNIRLPPTIPRPLTIHPPFSAQTKNAVSALSLISR